MEKTNLHPTPRAAMGGARADGEISFKMEQVLSSIYSSSKSKTNSDPESSGSLFFISAFRQLSRAKQTTTRYAGGEKGYTKKLTDQLQ